MGSVLAVAAGGAIGAVARYGVYVAAGRWLAHGFPWATLIVNVLGSLVLALLVELMAHRWQVSPEVRAFLAVGVMGSFTTFSTYALDVVSLAGRSEWGAAAAYALASVVFSVGAFLIGLRLGRYLLA